MGKHKPTKLPNNYSKKKDPITKITKLPLKLEDKQNLDIW